MDRSGWTVVRILTSQVYIPGKQQTTPSASTMGFRFFDSFFQQVVVFAAFPAPRASTIGGLPILQSSFLPNVVFPEQGN